MTQAEAKQAVARAFEEGVSRLFGILVTNLETANAADATRKFRAGFEFHLHALEIANAAAQELIKA
jgi:hypothetical protein